ncbi:hypothetical protein PR048_019070 [Dryococelus australis]|uniref:Uncharacterized protein n=1 Tax=Dryococelus australis TaxID=614101 RepID=A0ABQ9H2F9_9NEOP|nr:hypothetical protein PR048_019070 [Dryococelus australis]
MKRQQQQVTNFFQTKSKCIENHNDSASDVNISDSECKYFCSEDKGAVLITDCKQDPASTSSNNSKSYAMSIRDRESTSLCTEDTGAVLLSDSKSDIATADIIGTSSSPTVTHSFKAEWYMKWPWLHWDDTLGTVKCFVCLLAKELNIKVITSKVDPTFIVSGFYNWKKASEKLSYLENSESHKDSEKALLSFNQKPVSARLSAQVSKGLEKARKALITIVSSIKFLAGLILRGKQEKEEEIKYLTLKIGCSSGITGFPMISKIKYCKLLSLIVVRNLNQGIKKKMYLALIVDEMTDNSTKEQVSISLQNVSDGFDIFEDLIGLYETSSTTGDTLAAIIEDVLLRLDLPIEDNRGQYYDADGDLASAKNTTLKPLSPTRWTVRSKFWNVVNSQYETILSVLDSLKSRVCCKWIVCFL